MSLTHRAITLDVILTHFFNFKYGDSIDILDAFTFRLDNRTAKTRTGNDIFMQQLRTF